MVAGDGGHVWFPRASDPRIQEFMESTSDKPTIPDLVFKKLGELGYTGSIDDRWHQHLAALGYTDVSEPFSETLLLGGGGGSGDPLYGQVVHLGAWDGEDAATTATDDSYLANVLTFAGDAELDTTNKKYGTASLLLDGVGDYVSFPETDNVQLGNQDWTVEAHIMFPSTPSTTQKTIISHSAAGAYSWSIEYYNLNLRFLGSSNGLWYGTSVNASFGGTPVAGQWYHVAFSKSDGQIYGHIDGVGKTPTATDPILSPSVAPVKIGNRNNDFYFPGHIDNTRITVGAARYEPSVDFTPPTEAFPTTPSAATDPFWNEVIAFASFDGADAATAFTDESAAKRVWTFSGDAQLDDAQTKFGTTSLLLDGTGDYVSVPQSANLDIVDDFTLEMWVRFNGDPAGTSQDFVSKWGSIPQRGWVWGYSLGTMRFVYSTSGSTAFEINCAWAPSGDEWHHVALSRTGSTWSYHMDGVRIDTDSLGGSPYANDFPMTIGCEENGGVKANLFNGHIADFRFTQGRGRYPNPTYSVPTAALPTAGELATLPTVTTFGNIVWLMDFEGTDGDTTYTTLDSNAVAMAFTSPAHIEADQFKFGSTSLACLGGLGTARITQNDNAIHYMGGSDFTIETWIRFEDVDGATSGRVIAGSWDATSNREWVWQFENASDVRNLSFKYSTDGTNVANSFNGDWFPEIDTWYHVAVCRNGTGLRQFVNGEQIGPVHTIGTDTIYNGTRQKHINWNNSSDHYGDQYYDEFRWTIGEGLYTENFEPPTEVFPRS